MTYRAEAVTSSGTLDSVESETWPELLEGLEQMVERMKGKRHVHFSVVNVDRYDVDMVEGRWEPEDGLTTDERDDLEGVLP